MRARAPTRQARDNLEASLLAAKAPSAALRPLRLVVAASVVVVAVVVTAAVVVEAVVVTCFGLGRRRTTVESAAVLAATVSARPTVARPAEIASRSLLAGPVFGDVETQCTPGNLSPVNLLHCLCRVLFRGESNEREAPGSPGLAIFGDVHIHDFPDLTEELA